MNRNANSRFALAPSVNIPRTRMKRPYNHTSTADCGELVPFYCKPVLPGQTSKIYTHRVIRTQPLVSAPMQDLFSDTYYFFVPLRLLWNHAKEFFGENSSNTPWIPSVEYTIPQIQLFIDSEESSNSLRLGSIADHFGLPLNSVAKDNVFSVSSLPFRAYSLIVREFFQAQTVETPTPVPLDETTVYFNGTNELDTDYEDDMQLYLGGHPYIVNKFHDYFTSALPTPIRGDSVLALPDMPVLASSNNLTADQVYDIAGGRLMSGDKIPYPLNMRMDLDYNRSQNYVLHLQTSDGNNVSTLGQSWASDMYPTNLQAFSSTTIEDLRVAFAVQRLLERDNYGTRYREVLANHFGVRNSDASMQVPQYLGGNRKMLNISQVLQTSETNTTPLGYVGGYSLTSDSDYSFEASFSEHGYVIGLTCLRYKHRYSQGIAKDWKRKTRYDFFWPEFAHLGNDKILKSELFADGSSTDNDVFGYSEYAADYRFSVDSITGEMRPDQNLGLKSWTFGDVYDSHPTLSRSWLKEDKSNLDRALQVTSQDANQYWFNIQVEEVVTLPMPLYSIPALMSQF